MIRSNRPGAGKSSTRVFHVLLPAEAIGKLHLGPIARGTNMPLTVTFLNDNHGVMASASGELSAADLLDAVRRVNEFAVTTKPVCYTFFDFDGLTRISISIGDIARAADYAVEAAKLSDTERIVAIHANGEYAYRLALLYRAFIEETGWEARVFRERREAVSWLRGRAALKHGIIVEAV